MATALSSLGRKLYSASEFQRLIKAGTAPDKPLLRKAFIADSIKKVGKQGRIYQFTVSTEAPDRDHDVIASTGWKLDNYKKNPVVQWAHDYHALPVGKAVSITPASGKLVSRCEFATSEMNPMAECVYQMIDKGFLNATSVGFNPIKFMFNQERMGMDFAEHELLEYSIVPVPANPEALIEARSAGVDLRPIVKWAEGVLDHWHGEAMVAVPKSSLERVVTMLKGNKKTVVFNGEDSVQGHKGGGSAGEAHPQPARPGGGTSTHPFDPAGDHVGEQNPDKSGRDNQDTLNDQSTKPPVYGRGKEAEEEEDEQARQRKRKEEEERKRKELEEEADDISREMDEDEEEHKSKDDQDALEGHAIGFAPGDKGRKSDQTDVDGRAENPGTTMDNPTGNADAGQVPIASRWTGPTGNNPQKEEEEDEEERKQRVKEAEEEEEAARAKRKEAEEEEEEARRKRKKAEEEDDDEARKEAEEEEEAARNKRKEAEEEEDEAHQKRIAPKPSTDMPDSIHDPANTAKRRDSEDDDTTLDDDENGDELHNPSGVIPIGPKAIRRYAEKFGLKLVGEGKRVAVCPRADACPHKANQAIENCPAKRDCPLLMSAQQHPAEGQAIPPGWYSGPGNNPRTAIDPDGMALKLIRRIVKSGRTFNRENAEAIKGAHKHANAVHKFIIKAYDHHQMVKEHLKDLEARVREMDADDENDEASDSDYGDKYRATSTGSGKTGKGSTGLNPLSSAASEYDHMRGGDLTVVSPTFHAIEKRYGADDVILLVSEDVAKTYDLDQQDILDTLRQSLSETVADVLEKETERALNKARGRVD